MNSGALGEIALFIQQTCWAPAMGQELWWAQGVQRGVIEKKINLKETKNLQYCVISSILEERGEGAA